MDKKMTALIIMDGLGINENIEGNAVIAAGMPNLDRLMAEYPHTQIGASGMDVGLPDGQMGNSEVGHLNIGAGRIVYQELTRITRDIQTGDFFKKEPLIWAMDAVKNKGALHLMGLLSDGGVHSHNTHLYALVEMAAKRGVQNVFIHCLMDGRDVPPTSGIDYVRALEKELTRIGKGKIATVQGRYWGMDRDNIWQRVELGYNAIVMGEGVTAESAEEAVLQSYDKKETDEFIKPTVILENGAPIGTVNPGDSVVFFNFRPDRARQLTRTFIMENFDGFERKKGFMPLQFVSMTQYDETFTGLQIVNPPAKMNNTLGEYLAKLGKTQLRIAETQKYAHVTFFFNGGVEEKNEGEDRVLIPSDKEVATFDLKPRMSAPEVTEEALRRIASGAYDVMILNYANCDMVGHTGVMNAAVEAVREVDKDVGILADAILKAGGQVFITADHGNADQMIDLETGEPFTAHTTNPVPFVACGRQFIGRDMRSGGRLCDIAPTMLKAMGEKIPEEMTGEPLI